MSKVLDDPGLQYPPLASQSERVIYDNLFFLRRLVDSLRNVKPGLTETQARQLISQTITNIVTNTTAVVMFGTHANRLVQPIPVTGTVWYETDRIALYIVSDATGVGKWTYVSGSMIASLTSRPADLGTADAGFSFTSSDTDQETQYMWDGSEWLTVGGYLQEINDTNTNTVVIAQVLSHLSSAAGANGIGVGQLYQSKDTASQTENLLSMEGSFTNATSGSETSDWTLKLRNAGAALAKAFRVYIGGAIEIIGKIKLYNNAAPTNGQLLIGNTGGASFDASTLTGTANQIIVTNGAASITLSTPQDIGTGSSPTFLAITITNMTFNGGAVDTGPADSGGTGYKLMRVPN